MFKLFPTINFERITFCPLIWGCASHWPAMQGRERCVVRVVQNGVLKCVVVDNLVVYCTVSMCKAENITLSCAQLKSIVAGISSWGSHAFGKRVSYKAGRVELPDVAM